MTPKAYLATIQVLVRADSWAEACDGISETLQNKVVDCWHIGHIEAQVHDILPYLPYYCKRGNDEEGDFLE